MRRCVLLHGTAGVLIERRDGRLEQPARVEECSIGIIRPPDPNGLISTHYPNLYGVVAVDPAGGGAAPVRVERCEIWGSRRLGIWLAGGVGAAVTDCQVVRSGQLGPGEGGLLIDRRTGTRPADSRLPEISGCTIERSLGFGIRLLPRVGEETAASTGESDLCRDCLIRDNHEPAENSASAARISS